MNSWKIGNLILAEMAAIGWFLLSELSFVNLLILLPVSLIILRLPDFKTENWLLKVILNLASMLIAAYGTAMGFGAKGGWLSFFLLLLAIAVVVPKMPLREWLRVSNWLGIGFGATFLILTLGLLVDLHKVEVIPAVGSWWKVLIFFLLVLVEPLTGNKQLKKAPLCLCVILMPFSLFAYSLLGDRGFNIMEAPYLAALSGSTLISFGHMESILFALYFGLAVFKAAELGLILRKVLAKKVSA